MFRIRFAFVPFLILGASASADDSALAALDRAKVAHAKELARLHDQTLAEIDAIIKDLDDRGAGINYLLKERKGFADNDVTPILPKLLPASRKYLAAKKVADDKLTKAYSIAIAAMTKAGKIAEADRLREELKPLLPPHKPAAPIVESKAGLGRFLTDTRWAWNKGGILTLKPHGAVSHPGWDGSGWVMRWEPVDRRTFRMIIVKGSGTGGTATGRIAILKLSEDLLEFEGRDFNGTTIQTSKRTR